jgi:hypothetical protein
MSIPDRNAAAYYLAGLAVHRAAHGDLHALSVENPATILADAKSESERWVGIFLSGRERRAAAEPVLKGLLCGAIARRKAGASARSGEWHTALASLETSPALFKLAGELQNFVRANWLRIKLVANTLAVDRVLTSRQLAWILDAKEIPA